MFIVFPCNQPADPPQSTLFDQYRIESRQSNEIHLDLAIEPFAKALRSAEAALESSGGARAFGWGDHADAEAEGGTGCIMKLAKKNDKAVLVFEIKAYVSSRPGGGVPLFFVWLKQWSGRQTQVIRCRSATTLASLFSRPPR